MKEIKLTQGKVAFVDDSDFDFLNRFNWCATKCGNKFYATRMRDRIKGEKKSNILMHRVIMDAKSGELVDHGDFNGLNNQKNNLRVCTKAQNNTHRQPNSKTSSKYWDKKWSKWIARITHQGKLHRLGAFENEELAVIAYNEKAKELHGEFAALNIIP